MMRKKTALIVDDGGALAPKVEEILKGGGIETVLEPDPAKVLTRIRKIHPDWVLLDLMAPGLTTLELCREIRGMRPPKGGWVPKTVVVCDKPYEFDRKRAMTFGASAFFTQPLDPEPFLASLEKIAADRIEITFWGVRGTLPRPGPDSLRYGGNTNCVTMRFPDGTLLIFDAGTGIKKLSDHLLRQKNFPMEAKILLSHPHWDHINGIPFFVPLYVQGNEFEIMGAHHGGLSTRELISAQMDGVYFPVRIKEFGARVYFRDLKEETFDLDNGARIKTMLLSHPGNCLGYRIDYGGRRICFVTDNELYPPESRFHNPRYWEKLAAFIQGADALITDSTYTPAEYKTRVDWGHSSVDQVAALAHAGQVKVLHLHHHDPDQDDDAIDRKLAIAQETLEKLKSTTRCDAPKEDDQLLL